MWNKFFNSPLIWPRPIGKLQTKQQPSNDRASMVHDLSCLAWFWSETYVLWAKVPRLSVELLPHFVGRQPIYLEQTWPLIGIAFGSFMDVWIFLNEPQCSPQGDVPVHFDPKQTNIDVGVSSYHLRHQTTHKTR